MPAMQTATDSAATTPRTRSASSRSRSAAAPAPAPAPTGTGAAQGGERPAQRWLETARQRFAGDAGKEPITSGQLTYLLDLLHEPGQDRRLVSETYGYLDRGMSKPHATVQIRKLRGEFREGARAA